SGVSSYKELDAAIEFLKSKNVQLSVLQCTTSYPTPPDDYGVNVITELRERDSIPVGYSDHAAKLTTCIAAPVLGARILEFDAVFSRKSSGPDASSSLEMDEIQQLVKGVRDLEEALRHPVDKNDNSSFKELKMIFEKSLAVNKKLKAGHL